MIRIINLEEIQRTLLRVPGLVDLQERRDPEFVDEVKRWLAELEKLFNNNQAPEAAEVATLRGLLISAERRVIPAGVVFHGRPTLRKIKEASAAEMLRRAGEIVSNAIRRDRERVVEAERMCRQLVAVAKAKGLMGELPCVGPDYGEMLRAKWRVLSSDPDIAAGTVNMEGLVGPADVLIILDRAITNDLPRE